MLNNNLIKNLVIITNKDHYQIVILNKRNVSLKLIGLNNYQDNLYFNILGQKLLKIK